MITLAGRMRPHVAIGIGMNGLPTAMFRGMGDGTCYDATSGDAIPCPDTSSGSSDSSSGDSAFSSMTAAQQAAFLAAGGSPPTGSTINLTALAAAITAASTGAVNAIKATQSPYYLPNSTTLYNPATGQLTNAVGLTASTVASSATPLLIGVALIGAVLLFAMKK